MKQKYERKLISKEIELGVLYIPSEARGGFPKKNDKVRVFLGNKKEPVLLSYNSTYHRIFGLTAWYRTQNPSPKDVVLIEALAPGAIRLTYSQSETEADYTDEEVEEIVDLSGLPSATKGDIVEDRIKDIILLYGQGLLTVYRPVVDTKGIDLIIVKDGVYQPIFHGTGSGSFICDIREKNFKPHHTFFVVGAYFDPKEMELSDSILLIPTEVLLKLATRVTMKKGDIRYRIATQLSEKTKSKWRPYIYRKKEIAEIILDKFAEMEKYLK
jgi:hypothetical protein